ncbi:MAG: UDP-2,3-diacylglucosamine diphosphatase [Gemmatimonadaceae bacterium]
MLATPAFIISDAHLGVASRDVEQRLLGFLRALRGQAKSLVVNGDLFDFWFEWKSVIPRSSFRILAALADAHDAGIAILWIAGNHDCWGGELLRADIGATYHVGSWRGRIGPWEALVEHGDGLRPRADRRYRALRTLLRHPGAIAAFRWLHPDLATRLATGSSHASRVTRARDGGAELRSIALDTLAMAPELDLVVYGHSHVAALERAATGGVYGNAGSWLDRPTFLRVTEGTVELCHWNGSAEGLRLDVLDRRSEKSLP